MKVVYRTTEKGFEKFASIASAVMGNSITFIVVLCIIIFWLSSDRFYGQDIHTSIGDVILGVTFLSLFIIQKSFNRFSASLQLKLNELVASHETASNKLINVENKTEHELNQLSKEYTEMASLSNTEKGKKEDASEKINH